MGNEEVKIEKIDGTFIKIHCEDSVAKEMSDYFTFKVPNSQYSPAFKRRIWDGQIRLFNYFTRKIYTGLRNKIVQFCLDRNYECKFENFKEEFFEDYKPFIGNLQLYSDSGKIALRDYQRRAVEMALNHKRSLLISPTGSGKSLIIYCILRYLLSKQKKILVLVPTTSLVHQMQSDFIEYAGKEWNADKNIHIIYAGKEKETTKPIVVSTWQSVYDLPEKFFSEYDAVIGDECLEPNTLITMSNGEEKKISELCVGELVKTYNELTGTIEDKPIIKIHENVSIEEDMYEISLETGKTIRITGNHKVLLANGEWTRVDQLSDGDIINSIE